MLNIAATSMLLRAKTELPDGLDFAAEEFREGWNLVPAVNAGGLEKQIVACGWNFIRIADGSLKSGVGDTSREAIGSALKLALRRISTCSNAAQVDDIEVTQYPWFFLAKVRVFPYRIQRAAVLSMLDEADALPIRLRQRRLSSPAAALHPYFGSAMPQLKEMLISSGTAQSRQQ